MGRGQNNGVVFFTRLRSSHYYRRGIADVAQLVEQSIRNRQVTGSIPVVGSRNQCPASPAGLFAAHWFGTSRSTPFAHGVEHPSLRTARHRFSYWTQRLIVLVVVSRLDAGTFVSSRFRKEAPRHVRLLRKSLLFRAT